VNYKGKCIEDTVCVIARCTTCNLTGKRCRSCDEGTTRSYNRKKCLLPEEEDPDCPSKDCEDFIIDENENGIDDDEEDVIVVVTSPFVLPPAAVVGPCDPNPCANGGKCSVGESSFTCTCGLGTSGDTCETAEGGECPTHHPYTYAAGYYCCSIPIDEKGACWHVATPCVFFGANPCRDNAIVPWIIGGDVPWNVIGTPITGPGTGICPATNPYAYADGLNCCTLEINAEGACTGSGVACCHFGQIKPCQDHSASRWKAGTPADIIAGPFRSGVSDPLDARIQEGAGHGGASNIPYGTCP